MPPQDWFEVNYSKYQSLTATVVDILGNLLRSDKIDHLAISGRTKTLEGIWEKIKRKNYKNPKNELTDISGVRIILYFESDVSRASELIERSFAIDRKNSKNRESLLRVDQIGYRSVHYVCDLGPSRSGIPEYRQLDSLKFEIQVRTVLQHAWAELSHDRNYKFSTALPKNIERELFLYAGMLELADKGFDKLAKEIDLYASQVKEKTKIGDLSIEINAVSLQEFANSWSDKNQIVLESISNRFDVAVLVEELKGFGIHTLRQLADIIPHSFVETARRVGYSTTMFGLIRDWMLLKDWRRYKKEAWNENWYGALDPSAFLLFTELVGVETARRISSAFEA